MTIKNATDAHYNAVDLASSESSLMYFWLVGYYSFDFMHTMYSDDPIDRHHIGSTNIALQFNAFPILMRGLHVCLRLRPTSATPGLFAITISTFATMKRS